MMNICYIEVAQNVLKAVIRYMKFTNETYENTSEIYTNHIIAGLKLVAYDMIEIDPEYYVLFENRTEISYKDCKLDDRNEEYVKTRVDLTKIDVKTFKAVHLKDFIEVFKTKFEDLDFISKILFGSSKFKPNRQGDAHEAIMYLLNHFHLNPYVYVSLDGNVQVNGEKFILKYDVFNSRQIRPLYTCMPEIDPDECKRLYKLGYRYITKFDSGALVYTETYRNGSQKIQKWFTDNTSYVTKYLKNVDTVQIYGASYSGDSRFGHWYDKYDHNSLIKLLLIEAIHENKRSNSPENKSEEI